MTEPSKRGVLVRQDDEHMVLIIADAQGNPLTSVRFTGREGLMLAHRIREVAHRVGKDVKWCPRCKKEKHRSEFYLDGSRYDGLSGYCAPCKLAASNRLHDKKRKALLRKERAA
jgi:hypothetical protein